MKEERHGELFPYHNSATNVTVTLTLTADAAGDISGVLEKLALLLGITPPASFHIIERTVTPPSQKLGLCQSLWDGDAAGSTLTPLSHPTTCLVSHLHGMLLSSTAMDIGSMVNGTPKFCRHCDVVIVSDAIVKPVTEFPFLAIEDSQVSFCSSTCYMQYAFDHRAFSAKKVCPPLGSSLTPFSVTFVSLPMHIPMHFFLSLFPFTT